MKAFRKVAASTAVTLVSLLGLVSCNFTFTLFGNLDNRDDPRSYWYWDYSIEVIAGIGAGTLPDDNMSATELRLSELGDMVVRDNVLYLSDTMQNRVVKIDLGTNIATTIAGTGVPGYEGDGGSATSAELCYPSGLAVDDDGTVYIYDYGNNVIRKVSTTGLISTFVDLEATTGEANETYIGDSPDEFPGYVGIYGSTLYVLHGNKLYSMSKSSTSPVPVQYPTDKYWNWSFSQKIANAFTVADDGSVYVTYEVASGSDWPKYVGKITAGSTEVADLDIEPKYNSRLAVMGDGRVVYSILDGEAVYAYDPSSGSSATWTDSSFVNNMFCLDGSDRLVWFENGIVYRTPESGSTSTIAGKEVKTADASSPVGDFVHPYGVALSSDGTALYFTERDEGSVRRLTFGGSIDLREYVSASAWPMGIVATDAPAGAIYTMSGDVRIVEDAGSASSYLSNSSSYSFYDLAIKPGAEMYLADISYVYMIDGSALTIVAGNGETNNWRSFFSSITATTLALGYPYGLAFSSDGILYVAEQAGRIVSVEDGTATRFAGGSQSFRNFYREDEFGQAKDAGVQPYGLAFDGDGNLLVAHSEGIMRIGSSGIVEQLRFDVDGTTVDIKSRHNLAVDSAGCLYIPAGYQIIKATPRN